MGKDRFKGVLDYLSVFPDSFWSFARRGTQRYDGPIGRIYRTSDGEELDIYGSGRWGLVDPWEVRAFNGWNLIAPSGSLSTGWAATGSATINSAVSFSFSGAVGERIQRIPATSPAGTYTITAQFGPADIGKSVRLAAFYTAWDYGSAITIPASGTISRTVVATGDITNLAIGYNGSATTFLAFEFIQLERNSAFTAYDPRTTTGAGNSLWTKVYDQTGAGRHFEQASNLIMPYACRQGVPVTENGIQSAEFVAAEGRRMAVPSSTALYNFLHTTGGTVSSVFRTNDTAASKMIAGNRTTSNATRGVALFADAAEGVITRVGRIDVAGVATTGYSINRDTSLGRVLTNRSGLWHLDPDAVLASDRLAYWQNNANALSADNTESGTPFVESATGNLTLGAASDASIPFDGTITELAIWNSLLGSGDRSLLWSDASSLWGL